MLRVVVVTQYRRVTDRRTDEIAIASTALAMRALRRVVKISYFFICNSNSFHSILAFSAFDTVGWASARASDL